MREFDLLRHVYRSNPALGAPVLIPPGDDMGMVSLHGPLVLAAVDQLVAGRHFTPDSTPPALVGRKAVTRSLSDIAAMAAVPVATLAAVVLPPVFGHDRATALFDAMRETAAAYGAPLIGGDIAVHHESHHPLVCAITVLAEPAGHPPVTRSGAKPGDVIYVTGTLGGSLNADGSGHHLTFEPRIELALELSNHLGTRLHAMLDISDGLGRDASHIAECSGIEIQLDAARIPCRAGINWRRAMSDGEDYELCFAATGDVPREINGVPITPVGEALAVGEGRRVRESRAAAVVAGPRVIVRDGGTAYAADDFGWQHES
jgi:thiamine-monophosphate kinase